MSFLTPLLASAGPALAGAGAATAAAPVANAAATGLGKLLHVDPTRISSIANNVGNGMNQIAQAGGAAPSYQAPELPQVNNHLQLLDNNTLQALLRAFSGRSAQGQIQ